MKKKNLLKTILIILIIIGVSIISFGGIYVNDKNTVKNLVPDYILSRELKGYRELTIEPKVENEYNIVEEQTGEEQTEEEQTEEEKQKAEKEKKENYKKSKEIMQNRLSQMGIVDYIIKQDENNGNVIIEIPENDNTDQVVYELSNQGKFEIIDSDTSEVLMTNDDLKQVLAGYGTDNSGYTSIYASFEFNKEGTEKLKNITNTYIKTEKVNEENEEVSTEEQTENEEQENEESTEVIKNISIKIDGQDLLTTYFENEITNGILQLSFGSNSSLTVDEMQERLISAKNMAVLLNSGKMPIEYITTENSYISSDIEQNQINIVIYVTIAITVLTIIYLIVRYKKLGIKSALSGIGYIALLLFALRIFNVEIAISGIFATILSIVIYFAVINSILKENKKENNIEKVLAKTTLKYCIILMPVLTIAVVFTMIGISFGTVLFWGIFINILYNLSINKLLLVNKK